MRAEPLSRMMRLAASGFLSLLLLSGTACASGGGGGGGGNPDVITREQIEASQTTTALQAVQRLKPRWLQPPRANASFTGPAPEAVVFLDGVRYGDLRSLASINVTVIDSIEYMNGRDATTLYGTGYMGGAIMVHSIGR